MQYRLVLFFLQRLVRAQFLIPIQCSWLQYYSAGEIPSFQFFGSSDSVTHPDFPSGERSLFVPAQRGMGAAHPAGANKRSEYI